MKAVAPLRVHIQGAGKIGRTLERDLRRAGWKVALHASRQARPVRVDADVVILAVRDGQLSAEAEAWVGVVASHAVVLHMAGAVKPEVLAALRGSCCGIGKLHPLVSVASHNAPSNWDGAYALVAGDAQAVKAARMVASAVGMKALRGDDWDCVAYHAAAWLVAGGTVALFAAARDIMAGAGIEPTLAEKMMMPLLRSVAENIARVGIPGALSGVVRRADRDTLERHVHAVSNAASEHLPIYLAAARSQLRMGRELGEASNEALDELEKAIAMIQANEVIDEAGASEHSSMM